MFGLYPSQKVSFPVHLMSDPVGNINEQAFNTCNKPPCLEMSKVNLIYNGGFMLPISSIYKGWEHPKGKHMRVKSSRSQKRPTWEDKSMGIYPRG